MFAKFLKYKPNPDTKIFVRDFSDQVLDMELKPAQWVRVMLIYFEELKDPRFNSHTRLNLCIASLHRLQAYKETQLALIELFKKSEDQPIKYQKWILGQILRVPDKIIERRFRGQRLSLLLDSINDSEIRRHTPEQSRLWDSPTPINQSDSFQTNSFTQRDIGALEKAFKYGSVTNRRRALLQFFYSIPAEMHPEQTPLTFKNSLKEKPNHRPLVLPGLESRNSNPQLTA